MSNIRSLGTLASTVIGKDMLVNPQKWLEYKEFFRNSEGTLPKFRIPGVAPIKLLTDYNYCSYKGFLYIGYSWKGFHLYALHNGYSKTKELPGICQMLMCKETMKAYVIRKQNNKFYCGLLDPVGERKEVEVPHNSVLALTNDQFFLTGPDGRFKLLMGEDGMPYLERIPFGPFAVFDMFTVGGNTIQYTSKNITINGIIVDVIAAPVPSRDSKIAYSTLTHDNWILDTGKIVSKPRIPGYSALNRNGMVINKDIRSMVLRFADSREDIEFSGAAYYNYESGIIICRQLGGLSIRSVPGNIQVGFIAGNFNHGKIQSCGYMIIHYPDLDIPICTAYRYTGEMIFSNVYSHSYVDNPVNYGTRVTGTPAPNIMVPYIMEPGMAVPISLARLQEIIEKRR